MTSTLVWLRHRFQGCSEKHNPLFPVSLLSSRPGENWGLGKLLSVSSSQRLFAVKVPQPSMSIRDASRVQGTRLDQDSTAHVSHKHPGDGGSAFGARPGDHELRLLPDLRESGQGPAGL